MSPAAAARQSKPAAGRLSRSRSSGPAMTDSTSAASATVRVIGPMCSSDSQLETPGYRSSLVPGYSGTRPIVALTPHRPRKLAGMRTDPPPSLPSENGPMPVATATPDPADEPPEVRSRRHGLAVGSASGVCPVPLYPNSGTCVLLITIAPAALILSVPNTSSVAVDQLMGGPWPCLR